MRGPVARVAERVRRETGIVLAPSRETALRGAMSRAAPGLDPDDFLREISDPLRGRELMDRLVDEVTVQETSFARDRGQLDGIAWGGLLAGARRTGAGPVRVWSAGCATGEEPYTLALLAAESLGSAEAPVDVLGTDISRAALEAAALGCYQSRAVEPLGPGLRRRYFARHEDGTYEVADRLRGLVRFRRHNLARDAVPPLGEAPFDLIVCRNVLIYFDASLAGRLIGEFERSLKPAGTLLLGAADALMRPRRAATLDGLAQPSRAAARPPLPPPPLPPRRPLGREQRLTGALAAAGRGDLNQAHALVASLLSDDPLDPDANFVDGLVDLDAGEPASAVVALRRALYTDVSFALAAFELGRAYDALGDAAAARGAYARALRSLNPDDHRHELMLQQVDIGDIAAACRARLRG